MELTDNRYSRTRSILKILSVIMLAYGFFSHSPSLIAIGCGYVFAAANPFRYRIVINIGLILHSLQLLQAAYVFFTADSFHLYGESILAIVALAVLLKYYPSPYPIFTNLINFLMPTPMNVAIADTFPGLIKKLAGNGLIGKVDGLYINSDAFNIVQEEGFLGFTPSENIIDTAKRADVKPGRKLLDVGCGIGGPACLLASEFDLDVTGVDLLDWNAAFGNALAAQRGISDQCRFRQGNALALPFDDESFDYVFGMDAWCHVPGREKMIDECRRVLKKDGTILFHDWIMDKGDSEGFRFVYAFPPLETLESYSKKLEDAGFEIICGEKRNDDFRNHVAGLKESIRANKRRLIDACGRELYDNWDFIVDYTYKVIDDGRLGSGRFIARKK